MTNLTPRAKKLARSLRRANRVKSWRTIAREHYPPIVKPGTLHRIATSQKTTGEQWYPKNQEILIALGLIRPRKRRAVIPLEERSIDDLIAMRHRLAVRLEQIDGIIEGRAA